MTSFKLRWYNNYSRFGDIILLCDRCWAIAKNKIYKDITGKLSAPASQIRGVRTCFIALCFCSGDQVQVLPGVRVRRSAKRGARSANIDHSPSLVFMKKRAFDAKLMYTYNT